MRTHAPAQYLGNSPRRRRGRILLICVLTLSILISFLMLGNLLHDRMETAAPLLALPAISYKELAALAAENAFVPYIRGKAYPGILCAPDREVLEKPGDLAAYVSTVADIYDGVSIPLRDSQGHLFSSSAVPETDALYPRSTLDTLLRHAKEAKLSICAVWETDGTIPEVDSTDGRALVELCKTGFTEILFTTLHSDRLGERDIAAAIAMAEALKDAAPRLRVGFALEYELFLDADAAQTIEKIASVTDFLSVDIGSPPTADTDPTEYATTRCAALYGSIDYYPLRVFLRGTPPQWTAQIYTLRQIGYTAVQASCISYR